MIKTARLTLLLMAIVLPFVVQAQMIDGNLDDAFDPMLNDTVNIIVLQDNGNILVGGAFTTVGGQQFNRLARLLPNGSLDPDFAAVDISLDSGDAEVLALAVQTNGQIIVGGNFDRINDEPRNSIARLNADGTLDIMFNPNVTDRIAMGGDGSGAGDGSGGGGGGTVAGIVDTITLQMDADTEKILLGGMFGGVGGGVGGTVRNNIARLHPNGNLDMGFAPNPDDRVRTIVIDPNGQILIGGDFANIAGIAHNNLTRLNADGSPDMSFNLALIEVEGFASGVFSLDLQSDGKIVIVGFFASVDGVTRNNVARLNADGSFDASFIPPQINQFDTVEVVVTQRDDKLLIGGFFPSVAGQEMTDSITRLNADGSLDTRFVHNARPECVISIVLQSDDRILFGGMATNIVTAQGESPRFRLARLENEILPEIGFSSVTLEQPQSQEEGDQSVITFTFEVIRLFPVGVSLVEYVVSGATNAQDFGGITPRGAITFLPEESNKTISVTTTGDTQIEQNEVFNVTLIDPQNAALISAVAQATILNDDLAPIIRADELCLPITARNGNIAVVCL